MFTNRNWLRLTKGIKTGDADVVCLQEVRQRAVDGLGETGALDAYPHRFVVASERSDGLAVFSRFPIAKRVVTAGIGYPLMRVELDVDGEALVLYNVHTRAPLASLRKWRNDLDGVISSAGQEEGPVVIAGDFNATVRNAVFRQLKDQRFLEANEHCNQASTPTWPTFTLRGKRFGGLIRIDHVLSANGLVPIDVSPIDGGGSDHRGLLVHLVS